MRVFVTCRSAIYHVRVNQCMAIRPAEGSNAWRWRRGLPWRPDLEPIEATPSSLRVYQCLGFVSSDPIEEKSHDIAVERSQRLNP